MHPRFLTLYKKGGRDDSDNYKGVGSWGTGSYSEKNNLYLGVTLTVCRSEDVIWQYTTKQIMGSVINDQLKCM